MSDINFYDVLGLSPKADGEQIKAAYRLACKRYHPDSNPGFEVEFRAAQEAYETLSNPTERDRYDRQMGFGASNSTGSGSSTRSSAAEESQRPKTEYKPSAPPEVFVADLHPRARYLETWLIEGLLEEFPNVLEFCLDNRLAPSRLPQNVTGDWEKELSEILDSYQEKVLRRLFDTSDLADYFPTAEMRTKLWWNFSLVTETLSNDAEEFIETLFSRYARAETESIAAQTGEDPDALLEERLARRAAAQEEAKERQVAAIREKMQARQDAEALKKKVGTASLLTMIAATITALVVSSFLAYDWAMEKWGASSEKWATLNGVLPFSSESATYQITALSVSIAITLFVVSWTVLIGEESKGWDSRGVKYVSIALVIASAILSLPLILPVWAFVALLVFGLAVMAFMVFILFS